MPVMPNVPAVIRLDMHYQIGNDLNAMNRLFFMYNGTDSTTDLQSFLTSAVSLFSNPAGPHQTMCNNTAIIRMVATDLSTTSSPQVEDDTVIIGAQTYASVPAGTALVVKFHTARRYRGGHPRIYVPGMGISDLATPQSWNSTTISTLLSEWNYFIGGLASGTYGAMNTLKHVNVSYFQGFTNVTYPSGRTRPVPKLRVAGPIVDNITSLAINPKVASQRRRNLQAA
jgi:hypothetical protein